MHELYENTVRFEETDAQGIVFYGNNELLQVADVGHSDLLSPI